VDNLTRFAEFCRADRACMHALLGIHLFAKNANLSFKDSIKFLTAVNSRYERELSVFLMVGDILTGEEEEPLIEKPEFFLP